LVGDIRKVTPLTINHDPNSKSDGHSLIKGLPKTPRGVRNDIRKEMVQYFDWAIFNYS
jgi:hypothetical protein